MKILCYTNANRIYMLRDVSWLTLPRNYYPPNTSFGSLLVMCGVVRMRFKPIAPSRMWIRGLSNENNGRTSSSFTKRSPFYRLDTRSGKRRGDFLLAEVDRKKGGRLTSPSTMLMREATSPSYIVYYSLETAGSAPCHAQVANSTRGGLIGALFIHRQPLILTEHLQHAEIMVAFGVTFRHSGADRHRGALPKRTCALQRVCLISVNSWRNLPNIPRGQIPSTHKSQISKGE